MLYQQFIRVCEIDTKIAKLHASLTDLYAERAELLQVEPTGQRVDVVQQIPVGTASAKTSYDDLSVIWQAQYNIKLPTFRLISKKLERACGIMNQLAAENPQLQGNIKLVAVPPFAMLKKVLDAAPNQESLFVFADPDIFAKIQKSKSWSFIVVIDREFSLQVNNLHELLKGNELSYKEYDCGGLGVQELVAAELQGVKAVGEDGWTLLLKDSTQGNSVPCAKRQHDRIVFDIDDADCLLDNNFLQPAIQAV